MVILRNCGNFNADNLWVRHNALTETHLEELLTRI